MSYRNKESKKPKAEVETKYTKALKQYMRKQKRAKRHQECKDNTKHKINIIDNHSGIEIPAFLKIDKKAGNKKLWSSIV